MALLCQQIKTVAYKCVFKHKIHSCLMENARSQKLTSFVFTTFLWYLLICSDYVERDGIFLAKRLLRSKWNAKVTSKYPAPGTIKLGRGREQQAVLWSLELSADKPRANRCGRKSLCGAHWIPASDMHVNTHVEISCQL